MNRPRFPNDLLAIGVAALLASALPPIPASAAEPTEVAFTSTGAEQTWVVPADVTSIHVVVVGGHGGDFNPGGHGHSVTGDLAVTPGTTLYIEVGGNGANSIGLNGAAGGFNGGGTGGSGTENAGAGGGGASDIRTVSRNDSGTLASRLIVAGGGGGRGGSNTRGGDGGDAGSAGQDGTDDAGIGSAGSGGGAGTNAVGGAGGAGFGTGGVTGTAGAVGVGGAGGSGSGSFANGGGGGGGGYYGGGGGGASALAGGAGGGGGSSFVGAATAAFVSPDTSGVPSITITYAPDANPGPTSAPDTGVVDADVTVPTSAACVELSTTAISFGTQRFGTQDALATPGITVTNCSGTDESLLARVSAAAGTGATWTPLDTPGTCDAGTLGIDEFHLKIRRSGNEVDPVTYLGDANKELAELTGGAIADLDALLDMPCAGSAGAGQTMGMNIVFVVTEIQ